MTTSTEQLTQGAALEPVGCTIEGKNFPLEVCLSQQTTQLSQGLGQAFGVIDAKLANAERVATFGMWFSGVGVILTVAIIAVVSYLNFKR